MKKIIPYITGSIFLLALSGFFYRLFNDVKAQPRYTPPEVWEVVCFGPIFLLIAAGVFTIAYGIGWGIGKNLIGEGYEGEY